MFFWREPEVIVDASRYFTQAKHLKIYGIGYFLKEWGNSIPAWTDLPLIPFIYGMILKFFGEFRIYIQIFTTFLFSMTIVLTFLIGKTLWGEDVGFFGGVLLLGTPYLFIQVPLMLVDIPTMFFLTFSIFTTIKALNEGTVKFIVLSSLSIFLTFFSKYSTWLMLSVLIVVFLVLRTQNSKLQTPNYIYRGIVIALISVFLIGCVILSKYDVFSEQIKLLMAYQLPGLKRWGESFVSTFLFQIHPFITAAALYSTYAAFKKRDLKYTIISFLVILIVLMQIKRIRYIIMVFPMFALMASYGLREIKNIELRKFIVSCAVIFSLVVATFAYFPFIQKISTVNLKDAGEFLDSLDVKNVEVFTLPSIKPIVNPAVSVPILDLFTDKRIYYEYNPDFFPVSEEIKKSALRFTWEYKNPKYYTFNNEDSRKAIVVISSDIEQTLPEYIEQKTKKYPHSIVFKTTEGVFQYKTIVTVYYGKNG
ncbi:MAG: glycosyltransferase family 39 protein [Nitrospirota bacterium]